jgi:hypothetical protein
MQRYEKIKIAKEKKGLRKALKGCYSSIAYFLYNGLNKGRGLSLYASYNPQL